MNKISGTGPAASEGSILSRSYALQHPEFNKFLPQWKKIRDVLAGATHFKANAKKYVPALHDQSDPDFKRYVERGTFFNATGRTLEAMTGLLLRKSPEFSQGTLSDGFFADVDLNGTAFLDFVKTISEEMGSLGHGGTLVEYSTDEKRPFLIHYDSENVIDWEVKRVNGKMRLTKLKLKEESWEKNEAGDAYEQVTIFLNYEIEEEKLKVRKVTETAGTFTSVEDIEPVRTGKALHFIPFVFNTLNGNKPEILKPTLEDLTEVNISHFRTSCDLENGRHITGLPTPYAFGVDTDEDFILGTTHVWTSDNADAKVGFLEFSGGGLSELRDAIKEKAEQMASLGARMLEPEKAEAEAFGTVKLRADAEQATLINTSSAVSAVATQALQIAAWWQGSAKEPTDEAETFVILSTDFVGAKIDAQSLTALISSFQLGAISWPTLFYNLQQGELYSEGWTQEDEEKAMTEITPAKPILAEPEEEEDDLIE